MLVCNVIEILNDFVLFSVLMILFVLFCVIENILLDKLIVMYEIDYDSYFGFVFCEQQKIGIFKVFFILD